nr:alpha/beta hydrolase [Erythrobacter sp. F6033]
MIALFQVLLLPAAAQAQDYVGARTVSTTSWVEEWDPVSESWVRVADDVDAANEPVTTITTHIVNGQVVSETTKIGAARYAVPLRAQPESKAIAQYGPFRVIDGKRAAVVGTTGPQSPLHFDAMMRDFPQLAVLELVDAGGTSHDIANLEVGRRIRAAGLTTHVPNGGSARSGGVELFLAGEKRTMAAGAQFAVHSWLDNYGRQPADFAPDAPANRLYLNYYVEMGMSEDRARSFYAMTNSVPHSSALWLKADDMQSWIKPEHSPIMAVQAQVRMALTEPLPTPEISVTPVTLSVMIETAPVIDYKDVTRLAVADTAISGAETS